jgi:hypothetical protein
MRDGRQVGLRRAAVLLVLPLPSVTPLPAAPAVERAAGEIVALPTATGAMLQTRVLRPPGRARFPLAIVGHGSPPDSPPNGGALWQRMFPDSLRH